MNVFLASVKRGVGSKICRLFLFLAVLMPILLLSQQALAAKVVTELTLSLHDGQYDYNNEARAGQDNKFFLDVRNTGTTPITNIKLSSEAPEGWTILINPAQIGSLNSGSLQTVDVDIRPVGSATTQGYQVTFTAQATEITNVKQSFYINVKPAQVWLWVWLVAGIVVVAGFVFVYMKFGRK